MAPETIPGSELLQENINVYQKPLNKQDRLRQNNGVNDNFPNESTAFSETDPNIPVASNPLLLPKKSNSAADSDHSRELSNSKVEGPRKEAAPARRKYPPVIDISKLPQGLLEYFAVIRERYRLAAIRKKNAPDSDSENSEENRAPSPFGSTLKKERTDLTERNLNDLDSHNVSKELASQIFDRFGISRRSPDTKDKGKEIARSVSSGDVDLEDVPGFFAGFPRDDRYLVEIAEFLTDQDLKSGIPEFCTSPFKEPNFSSASSTSSDSKRQPPPPPSLGNPVSINHPTHASSHFSNRDGELSGVDFYPFDGALGEPCEEEIENFMEKYLLPKHRAEYEKELKDESQKEATEPNRNDRSYEHPAFTAYCTLENIKKDTSNEEEPSGQVDLTDGVIPRRRDLRGEQTNQVYSGGSASGRLASSNRGGETSGYEGGDSNDGMDKKYDDRKPDEIKMVPGLYEWDLYKTLLDEFTWIFNVGIPRPKSRQAQLKPCGRPIIPSTIHIDRYTIIATYHPGLNNMLIDFLVDPLRLPEQFCDDQLVDLIKLQKETCIPPYFCHRIGGDTNPLTVSEWSLCTVSGDGIDTLFVSHMDVMTHRIVNAMVTHLERKLGLKSGYHQKPPGCLEICNVQVGFSINGIDEHMIATVPLGYHLPVNNLDWKYGKLEHALAHTRRSTFENVNWPSSWFMGGLDEELEWEAVDCE